MGVQNENCSLKTKQPNNNKLSENFLFRKLDLSQSKLYELIKHFIGEFDPGSGRTLAACLIHASRANRWELAPFG
jgi:hypothetical protein